MPYLNQPLGTIISSVLTYDQLNDSLNHEARGCHNTTSTYAPCDGRSIAGSALAAILVTNIGTANVPDLRGKFIRGLNAFHLEGQPPFDPSTSDPAINRRAGEYQADSFKEHAHGYTHFDGGQINDMSNDTDQRRASYGNMIPATTASEGDVENRPKNVALYFYIKIN